MADTKRDWAACGASAAVALAGFGAVTGARSRGILSRLHARKALHMCAGLGLVATWPLYSAAGGARTRLLAALTPLALTARMAAAGLGIIRAPKLVETASRSGNRRELLLGPTIYGLVIVALTLTHWRSTPAAVAAIGALCGGDGVADVAGRRWGARTGPLTHNKNKTWAGTLACFAGAFAAALPEVLLMNAAGCYERRLSLQRAVGGCAVCALAAAAVETLPLKEVDNVTVPLAVLAVAPRAFGS